VGASFHNIDPQCARRAAGSWNRLDRPAPSNNVTASGTWLHLKGLPAISGFGDNLFHKFNRVIAPARQSDGMAVATMWWAGRPSSDD
jgi:hypothetical protein